MPIKMAENKAEDKAQEEKQKEIQKKYIEYQVMEQQIKQLQQQLEKMEMQTKEIEAVEQSLSDISKAKDGDEILVPVSGGVFFKASVKDCKNFLVNVGHNVVVEKGLEGTKHLVHSQSEEIDKYKEQVTTQLAMNLEQHQQMENELKKLVED
jgi:prefoldin alpha subunit